jgi:hypothetical protein
MKIFPIQAQQMRRWKNLKTMSKIIDFCLRHFLYPESVTSRVKVFHPAGANSRQIGQR